MDDPDLKRLMSERKILARRTIIFVALLWTLLTSWLATAYVVGWNVRHQLIENAWFILAGLFVVIAFQAVRHDDRTDHPAISNTAARLPLWNTAAFMVLAFAAFWPSLSVGLLSDDFVVFSRAQRGVFFPDSQWIFFRPVVLIAWRTLGALFPDSAIPLVLHSMNIALHGINSSLLAFLVVRFGGSRATACLAGGIFLVFPLHTEAVTWISGGFDVLLLTLFLLLVMVTTSKRFNGYWRIVTIAILGLLALGTKETAVAISIFVAVVVAFGYPGRVTELRWIVLVLVFETIIYLGFRLVDGVSSDIFPPFSAYRFKEFLSRPFASLGLPFHERLLEGTPLWALPSTAGLPFLFTAWALRWRKHPDDVRIAIALILWILVGVAPVFTMFIVTPDLQGSRYLYVSSAAWAFLIAWSLHQVDRSLFRKIGILVGVFWIVISFTALRSHQAVWLDAARARDRVLQEVILLPERCKSVAVREVPDNVNGAYVFRNGLTEAVRFVRPNLKLVEENNRIRQRCIVQ